jgi:thioredoxin reductase (NADPH)
MGRIASIPGEAEFLGRGVSYCATCDGAFYRNREVAVVGLNHEAVEEAQVLTKFASTVHWITPKDPRTLENTNGHVGELLAHPSLKVWEKARLLKIKGEDSGVTGVEVRHPAQETQDLHVEGVFVYMQGSKPITDFLGGQVALNPDGGVKVDPMMQTSVEGVWAIGDIRNTPFKQAVVAAGDGCIAAMAIDRYLNSRKAIKPDWAH